MRLRLLIATVLLAASTLSHADTYQKFDLGPGRTFNQQDDPPLGLKPRAQLLFLLIPQYAVCMRPPTSAMRPGLMAGS
jgi:hypothetical protein